MGRRAATTTVRVRAALVAVLLGATACAPGGTVQAGGTAIGDASRAAVDPAADTATAAAGTRALGHRLVGELVGSAEGGNVVVSPASIATAFAMLREGADGRTAEQIDDVMGYPADSGAAYNALLQAWDLPEDDAGPVLDVACSVWAARDLPLEDGFLDALSSQFGTGVERVDFADPATVEAINAWTAERTRGRIEKVFETLPADTVAALVNTVYLKAAWEIPFRQDMTSDQPFSRADGSRVEVPMMRDASSPRAVATGEGWTAVRLGVRDSRLAMWVLVPDGSVADPVRLLDPAVLATAQRDATPVPVDLTLPRWDLQTQVSLVESLQVLGITEVFGPADLSRMTSAGGVFVGQVRHTADITVDEAGFEAAAATGIAVDVSAPPPPQVVVRADRPFAWVVTDEYGTALFEGVVGDPSLSRE